MHLSTDNMKKRNPKSRSSFLCCLILILVFLLTACAGSGTGTGSAAGNAKVGSDNNAAKQGQNSSAAATEPDGIAAEPESDDSAEPLRIGVLKIADSFPLYAAVEEGLFEKRGLQVEIIEFQSASDQSVAYEAGELDGMMTDMIVQSLINKAAGEDGMRAVAMALGGSPEEGRFLVVSSPSAGIESPEDLIGKRIGISENTMMEYLVTRYLEDLGIDPGQTQMVNISKLTLRLDAVMEGLPADVRGHRGPCPNECCALWHSRDCREHPVQVALREEGLISSLIPIVNPDTPLLLLTAKKFAFSSSAFRT